MNFLRTIQNSHPKGANEPLFSVGELPDRMEFDSEQEEIEHLEKENIMLKNKLKLMLKNVVLLGEEVNLYEQQLSEFKKLIADTQEGQMFVELIQKNTESVTNDMNDPRCDLFTMEKTEVKD